MLVYVNTMDTHTHIYIHTFNRDVLDGEAQDDGPDHTKSHLPITVNNFCKNTHIINHGNRQNIKDYKLRSYGSAIVHLLRYCC